MCGVNEATCWDVVSLMDWWYFINIFNPLKLLSQVCSSWILHPTPNQICPQKSQNITIQNKECLLMYLIKILEIRPPWISKKRGWYRKSYVKTEADCSDVSIKPRKPRIIREKTWGWVLLRASKEAKSADSLILDFCPPELWGNTFLLF